MHYLFPVLLLAFCAAFAHASSVEEYVFESQGEQVKAELGRFSVPEYRNDPDSREIELAYIRFPATTAEPGPPIVYLAGGPGGAGTGTARSERFHLFMKLREVADVIAFDQRGTGMSEPNMNCDARWNLPLDEAPDRALWGQHAADLAATCRESLVAQGIDPAGYTTRESAADVNALREALGVEKISLWGTSYGTHLGFAVLRDFGENIHRAVFAGAEGPDHTLKLPSAVQTQLETVETLIESDANWGPILPDVLGLIEHSLAELAAEPKTVALGSGNVVLGPLDLQAYVANEIGSRDGIARLPVMLAALQEGNYRRLAGFAIGVHNRPAGSAMSGLMDCASGATADRLARIQREANNTLLGDAVNFPYMEVCQGWNAADPGDDFRGEIVSAVPVLFVSGTLDGRTPPANAEALLPGFKNGRHLIVENAGHDEQLFSLAPDLADAMLAFFRGEEELPARISAPPIEFVAPRP